jgi:hypothetical protein
MTVVQIRGKSIGRRSKVTTGRKAFVEIGDGRPSTRTAAVKKFSACMCALVGQNLLAIYSLIGVALVADETLPPRILPFPVKTATSRVNTGRRLFAEGGTDALRGAVEAMEARLSEGQSIDVGVFARLTGCLCRLFELIGITRAGRSRSIRKASLSGPCRPIRARPSTMTTMTSRP